MMTFRLCNLEISIITETNFKPAINGFIKNIELSFKNKKGLSNL
ncbi:hypothetical protein BN170_2710001 [Clostridioides difficile T22]|nr:hypothetical protein BN170_2710001 [Clostridioides difficile T22]